MDHHTSSTTKGEGLAPLVVGLVCTQDFRQTNPDPYHLFLCQLLDWAFGSEAQLLVTANTYDWSHELLLSKPAVSAKEQGERMDKWSHIARRIAAGSSGVVELTFEMIERRIDAVFHLARGGEVNTNLPMRVLKRQALVHNVLYTASVEAATSLVKRWSGGLTSPSPGRTEVKDGAAGLLAARAHRPATHRVPFDRMSQQGKKTIALIAHDGKKLDMCLLVVSHLRTLLTAFDYFLCTGTTGGWIVQFIKAAITNADPSLAAIAGNIEKRVICCESGPKGGDVQIAQVVLNNLCHQVIFLIDPMAAHPHEPDISFFEQVIDIQGVHLATNLQSAEQLLVQYEH